MILAAGFHKRRANGLHGFNMLDHVAGTALIGNAIIKLKRLHIFCSVIWPRPFPMLFYYIGPWRGATTRSSACRLTGYKSSVFLLVESLSL